MRGHAGDAENSLRELAALPGNPEALRRIHGLACQFLGLRALLALGGGCVLDTCKCVGNLLNNPGKAENYQGWELVKNPAPYKIAIPTLSGTGSETSRTGIICNEAKNIKLGMNSDYTMFEQVLLDPDLTASVPRNQYFYTGIDTYMHCFESITGSYRNVVVDSLAEKAIDLSKQVYLSSDMMSDENREKLMIASFLGGMAAGFVGVVHPISAGLSMVLHMHHGIANCYALTVLEDIYPDEYKDFMLMMDRQCIDLVAGHEVAVGGDQQYRCRDGGSQAKQAFRTIGDQQVRLNACQ